MCRHPVTEMAKFHRDQRGRGGADSRWLNPHAEAVISLNKSRWLLFNQEGFSYIGSGSLRQGTIIGMLGGQEIWRAPKAWKELRTKDQLKTIARNNGVKDETLWKLLQVRLKIATSRFCAFVSLFPRLTPLRTSVHIPWKWECISLSKWPIERSPTRYS